jgi:maleylacetoacetate isomerase
LSFLEPLEGKCPALQGRQDDYFNSSRFLFTLALPSKYIIHSLTAPNLTMPEQKLLLHSYFRSSCSARVRTAAHLKGIELSYTYINLLSKDQHSPTYTATNPSASVPTLTVTTTSGEEIVIRQSIAILEFLEEYFPSSPRLLPPQNDVVGRARVRELVNIVANDIQPPTNLRILRKVKALGGDEAPAEWAKEFMTLGLQAYDKIAEKYAGKYSVGDEVTLADVVLAPAVEGAVRWGVDLGELGTVSRVYESIRGLEAFRRGDWRHQEDTPEEFRVKGEEIKL